MLLWDHTAIRTTRVSILILHYTSSVNLAQDIKLNPYAHSLQFFLISAFSYTSFSILTAYPSQKCFQHKIVEIGYANMQPFYMHQIINIIHLQFTNTQALHYISLYLDRYLYYKCNFYTILVNRFPKCDNCFIVHTNTYNVFGIEVL